MACFCILPRCKQREIKIRKSWKRPSLLLDQRELPPFVPWNSKEIFSGWKIFFSEKVENNSPFKQNLFFSNGLWATEFKTIQICLHNKFRYTLGLQIYRSHTYVRPIHICDGVFHTWSLPRHAQKGRQSFITLYYWCFHFVFCVLLLYILVVL